MVEVKRFSSFLIIVLLGFMLIATPNASAASAGEIEASIDESIKRFRAEVGGGKKLLQKAKGVLIFPSVIKAGIGIGGEYGEGALQINDKTVDYYSTAGASIGFQLGVQARTVFVLFMTNDALKHFRNSKGWKAGVDGSVTLVTLDAGAEIDTETAEDPILGFVMSRRGWMYNLTIEGSKFTRIKR